MDISNLNKDMLREIVRYLRKECGDRLEDVILFGSYAKGTANSNSDIDILAMLSGTLESLEDFDDYPKVDYKTMLKLYKAPIHCCVLSSKDYVDGKNKVFRDVREYGISILNL